MQVPTFRTWTAGEIATASYFNSNVRDAGNFFLQPPLLVATQSAAQSLTSGTWTPILLDQESIDRDNSHSTSSNTSRWNPQTPGWYALRGIVAFTNPGTAVGVRGCGFCKNGDIANVYFRHEVPGVSAYPTCLPTVGEFYMNGTTDYVELVGVQTQGTALNTEVVTGANSSLVAKFESS